MNETLEVKTTTKAQLISAAPELLEALQAVQQTLAAYLSDDHITMSDKLCQQLELQAREAIAKATGK